MVFFFLSFLQRSNHKAGNSGCHIFVHEGGFFVCYGLVGLLLASQINLSIFIEVKVKNFWPGNVSLGRL